MTYTETVRIERETFKRVNRLLAIENMENMTDEELYKAGADTDTCFGVFSVTFKNGATLNYDLCSGTSNYFDDVVLTSADGTHDVILECEFELDNIEVEIDGDTYIVILEVF